MGRIKELDGLRAVAILAVLISHFAHRDTVLANVLHLGWAGVDLFFAISGFLITRILIALREKESPFRTFYWRRTLRIFPPYYLALALMVVLSLMHSERISYRPLLQSALFLSSARTHPLKLAAERMFLQESTALPPDPIRREYSLPLFTDCFDVYWSLSVEELFYLIWAPVMLKGSRRLILLGSIIPILICPVLRGLAHRTPNFDESFGFIFRFDSLAFGSSVAMLFWGVENRYLQRKLVDCVLIVILVLSAFGFLILMMNCGGLHGVDVRTTFSFSVFGFSLLALLCASLVGICARWSGRLKGLYLLRSKAAVYLGTVSYTVYLIHLPMYIVVGLTGIRYFGRAAVTGDPAVGFFCSTIAAISAIALAILSWKYVEEPILRLKDRWFPMTAIPRAVSAPCEVDPTCGVCA